MYQALYASDILRLFGVVIFGYAAWCDLKTRRIYNRVWVPLFVLGVTALLIDLFYYVSFAQADLFQYSIGVVLSALFVGGAGVLFTYLRLLGGADGKALLSISILYPYPLLFSPLVVDLSSSYTSTGLMSLDIIVNCSVATIVFSLVLVIINVINGNIDLKALFVARKVKLSDLNTIPGKVYETGDGVVYDGVDLDSLRMYLRWRGITVDDVMEYPDTIRNPNSIGETHSPTDGRVGISVDKSSFDDEVYNGGEYTDEWGVDEFLDDVDRSVYGASAEQIRSALDLISNPQVDSVYVSPGIPLVTIIFVSLLVTVLIGNVVYVLPIIV